MRTVKLKRSIPKGTLIVDLYEDGDLYYKMKNAYYPVDFNDFKHSDFCEEINQPNQPTE